MNGAITDAGSVRHGVVEAALGNDFELLRGPFLGLGPVACDLNIGSIVDAVTRRAWKPQHPLKQLALISVMFKSDEELDAALAGTASPDFAEGQPSSEGPVRKSPRWPKTEIAASEPRYAAFVRYLTERDSVSAASKAAAVAVATGLRWARQLGVDVTPRPKKMNAIAYESMRSALRLGQDRTEVAAAHGVAVGFVHRLLSTEHSLLAEWRAERDRRTRLEHRAVLIATIKTRPQITSSDLRRFAERVGLALSA